MNVNERLDRLEKELKELNRRRILDRLWFEDIIRHNTRRSGARLQYVVDCNKFYFNLFNEEHPPEIKGRIKEEIAAKYSDYRARVRAFEKEFESSAIYDSAKRYKEEDEGNYFMDDIYPLDMTHEAPELRAKVRQEREEEIGGVKRD